MAVTAVLGVAALGAAGDRTAVAQSSLSIDDRRKAFDDIFDTQRKTFDKNLDRKRQAFDQLLRQRWKEFDTQIAKSRFVRPKLTALPTFEETPLQRIEPRVPSPGPVRAKPPVVAPKKPSVEERRQKSQKERQKSPASPTPQTPPAPVPSETELGTRATFTLSFFGEGLTFAGDNKTRGGSGVEASPDLVRNQSGLSRYWRTSNVAERRLVSDLKRHARQLKLDDWMTYQLVRQLSKALVPDRSDTRAALAWKLLNRIGFDVRIAKRSGRLSLLVPIARQVYGVSYITIGGQKFYALDTVKSKGRFSTYPGVASDRRILNQFSPGKVFWQPSTKHQAKQTLRAKKGSASYALDLQYDPRDVASLASYPQFDFGFYFKNPTRALLEQDVRSQLAKYTESKREMGEILLRLVQLGLTYETDQEQFGKENYLFGDETLSYAIADCEDRSILYAGLIKKHLGIDYVVLLYPGHLAVALDMPGDGDHVTHNGKRYLVADPTYMRAPIGYEMKQYRNRGKVIYASKEN